eukprot:2631437-Pyramimonas_sp.AAC.1
MRRPPVQTGPSPVLGLELPSDEHARWDDLRDMLPVGRRFLHDALPRRVRDPDAMGEVRYSAMPPPGV